MSLGLSLCLRLWSGWSLLIIGCCTFTTTCAGCSLPAPCTISRLCTAHGWNYSRCLTYHLSCSLGRRDFAATLFLSRRWLMATGRCGSIKGLAYLMNFMKRVVKDSHVFVNSTIGVCHPGICYARGRRAASKSWPPGLRIDRCVGLLSIASQQDDFIANQRDILTKNIIWPIYYQIYVIYS